MFLDNHKTAESNRIYCANFSGHSFRRGLPSKYSLNRHIMYKCGVSYNLNLMFIKNDSVVNQL